MRKLIPVTFALSMAVLSSIVLCQNRGFVFVESPNITLSAQLTLPPDHGQPGMVIYAGHKEVSRSEKYFYFTVIDENGVPVDSFGGNGELQLEDSGEDIGITSLVCLDATCSEIVAGGYKDKEDKEDKEDTEIALLCIDREGKTCPSFGDQQGQVLKLIDGKSAKIFALESIPPANGQPGYLLAAGLCHSGSDSPNSCMMTFHNNGTVKFDFYNPDDNSRQWYKSQSMSTGHDQINSMVRVNNQIVATGFSWNENKELEGLSIARYFLPNMTSDVSFGKPINGTIRQGYRIITLPDYIQVQGKTLGYLNNTDGQIEYIVAGKYTSSVESSLLTKPRYLIGKINHLGDWDDSFYKNFTSSIPDGISKNSKVNSLLIYSPEDNRSDTRIYAAGELKEDIALWCVHTNGSHCADFANSGVQTFDINNGTDSASALVNTTLTDLNEPRLLVAGYGTVNGTLRGGTIRLFMDGRVDLCYGHPDLATELTLESVPENYTLSGMVNTDETANSSQPAVLISHSPSGVTLQNFTFKGNSSFNLSNIEPGNYSVELYQCGRLLSQSNLSFPEEPTEPAYSGASKETSYGFLMLLGLAYALLN